MNLFWGLLIPFLGTTLGSMTVFLMKNKMNNIMSPRHTRTHPTFTGKKNV